MIKHYVLGLFFLFASLPLFASEETIHGLQLTEAPINRYDLDSIKRGAKFFASNCMSCHTLIYLKNDKLAHEVGITYDKMPLNIKTWPYGVTPPDLSLEASARGIDWIYTFLHSFYQDPKRPTGANNLLFEGLAMPAILAPYQGTQIRVDHPKYDLMHHVQWYDLVKLTKSGTMSPEDYDATVADVVNFLAYAAEPYWIEQHRIGYWVLAFLVLLYVMTYVLKKEYWKDVKAYKEEEV